MQARRANSLVTSPTVTITLARSRRDAQTNSTMTRSESLAAAEKLALEGHNDSQDSQAIFDAHQALFGVGTVRTRNLAAVLH